jgi:hypothetical protein
MMFFVPRGEMSMFDVCFCFITSTPFVEWNALFLRDISRCELENYVSDEQLQVQNMTTQFIDVRQL